MPILFTYNKNETTAELCINGIHWDLIALAIYLSVFMYTLWVFKQINMSHL